MSGSKGHMPLSGMVDWANRLMASREPDFIIGDNYLRRWWVIPRNSGCNVYLHEILHSDDDRALHDHPWSNTSFILEGGYIEITPEGRFERKAGDILHRPATAQHRLEVPDGGRALTLFMTGAVERTWGFHCPKGFVPWFDFVDDADKGKTGRGCGEYA